MSSFLIKISTIFVLGIVYYAVGSAIFSAGRQVGLTGFQSGIFSFLGLTILDQFIRSIPDRIQRLKG